MTPKQPTMPPPGRGRELYTSIDSARAVSRRCEARLDTARLQVLRADAVVRRVRVYLEKYDERYDTPAAPQFAAATGARRLR